MAQSLISRRAVIALAGGALAAPMVHRAHAAQPLRVIVPFGAGGVTDVLGRLISPRLGELLQRTVLIENRPSASSIVGTQAVVNAQPNGDTILLADTTLPLLPVLHPELPFDIFKGLTPLGIPATGPTTLVVRASLNARTVKDVVELAKAEPGKLSYGTGSIGGTAHLAALLLQEVAGIRLNHVPYAGAGQAMNDLLGGHIDITFAAYAAVEGAIESKLVIPIATTGAERNPSAPELPTFVESGLPIVVLSHWGFYGPAGLDPTIVETLSGAIQRAAQDEKVKSDLIRLGYVPLGTNAARHAEILREEYEKWGGVMRRSERLQANEKR